MRSTVLGRSIIMASVMCLPSSAAAQTFQSGARIGGGFGGTFGDGGPAPAVSLNGGYRFTPRVGLEVDASYVTKLDFGDFPACPPERLCIAIIGGNFSVRGRALSVSGNFVSELPVRTTRLRPYVVAGGGVARVRYEQRHDFLPIRQTLTSTGPMLTFGGGVDFALVRRLTLGVDLRHQWLFPEDRFDRTDIDADVHLTRAGAILSVRF